jgi:hypothetical protein
MIVGVRRVERCPQMNEHYHTDVHTAVKFARTVPQQSVRQGGADCDGGSEKGAVVNDGPGSGPKVGNERATAR